MASQVSSSGAPAASLQQVLGPSLAAHLPLGGAVSASAGGQKKERAWLTSFADLTALVLTFFVLLFSLSTIRTDLRIAIVTEEKVVDEDIRIKQTVYQQLNSENIRLEKSLSTSYIARVLEANFNDNIVLSEAFFSSGADWVALSLPVDLVFEAGSATLKPLAEETLLELSALIRNLPSRVDVVGHANPDPISTSQFPSNWHLSMARAQAVGTVLGQARLSRNLRVLARADGDFALLDERLSEDERKQLALRVDVILFEDVLPRRDARG